MIERWGARLAVSAAWTLFSTVKRQLTYANPATDPYRLPQDGTFIYSVWHDSLLMPLFLGRQPRTIALVGRHQDGAFLAHSLKALKIDTVRGSSSRGAVEAVRQLLGDHQDRHIVVTPDGPRGPRREMKAGIAYLSSRTGKPVVPTAFACRHSWSAGAGWTHLTIPRPWTTVYAMAGECLHVPAQADKDQLQEFTERIQNEMDRLNLLVEELATEPKARDSIPLTTESQTTNDHDSHFRR